MINKNFLLATLMFMSLVSFPSAAQKTSAAFEGGSVLIGFDNRTCDGTLAGSIRYNPTTKCPEFCDGDEWVCPGSASCSLDGQNVPHGQSHTFYSETEHADCASVSQNRTCTNGTLGGDPSYQYANCEPPSGPTGCDNIGDECSDGSIYAGLSPDGNVKMYTTPADQGQYPWNNGNSSNYVTTNQTSNITGQSNTANLITIDSDSGTSGTQPHQAAQACADSNAHGHTDWYLPARDELNVLYVNRTAIGGFDTSGSWPSGSYWASSEVTNQNAKLHRFSDGLQSETAKWVSLSVRCVRK